MSSRYAVAYAAAGALLLAAAPLCAFAADSANAGAAIDPAAIYLRHCSACHGEKGDGNSRAQSALAKKPRNFTAAESRLRLTREYMIAIVRDGRPHTPMMARKSRLSQEEIEALVDFIRGRFMPAEPEDRPAQAN